MDHHRITKIESWQSLHCQFSLLGSYSNYDKLITEDSLFEFVFNGLMDVSASRWGYARYPSPVWTDETDHQYMRERLPNVYQVFGHTQRESEPVITEQYACLDCRRAFLLTSKGNIIEA
jgi:hypothetical protein